MHSPNNPLTARKVNEQLQAQLGKIRQDTIAFNLQQASLAIKVWQSTMKELKKKKTRSEEEMDAIEYDKNVNSAIKAGEYLVDSLYKSMLIISKSTHSEGLDTRLSWSGSKTELIELGYALQYSKLVNQGRSQLCQVMELLEKAFQIDLGHYPRTFQEIINRKGGSSKVAEKLRDGLLSHVYKSLEK